MGQFESKNFYRAGSFRVHGPYHTEKGKDTLEFIARLIKIEQMERKIKLYSESCSKDACYIQSFGLTENTELFIAIKNNVYDIGVHDLDTNEYRIDISQSELNALVEMTGVTARRYIACLNYALIVNTPELQAKIEDDPYFKRYNPAVNPVRGSPPDQRFDELFDRG